MRLFSNREFVEKIRPIVNTKWSLAEASMTEEAYRQRLAELDKQWKEQAAPVLAAELDRAGLAEAEIPRIRPRETIGSGFLDHLYVGMTPEARRAVNPDRAGFTNFVSTALEYVYEAMAPKQR